MYFDTKPKEKISDFYNYKAEYDAIKKALAGDEFFIVLKGLRRTGKTSLMRVLYNSTKQKKIWIDARSVRNLEKAIMEEIINRLNEIDVKERLASAFEGLSFYIQLKKKQRTEYFHEILKKVDAALADQNLFLCIFIDEVQLFPKSPRFLAYLLDNSKRIKLIVSGSEIGLLERIVGERYESALFGRARLIINMKHLPYEKSVDFLKKGALMADMALNIEHINETVELFDGTIGWLTLYGFYAKNYGHEKAIREVKKEGKKVVAYELNNFFRDRGEAIPNYKTILKMIAGKERSWNELRNATNLDDKKLSRYLSGLISHGFVEKKEARYYIPDPILKEYLLSVG